MEMPEMKSDRIAQIRKSITVRWDRETAFRRFTAEIEWWPLERYSVSATAGPRSRWRKVGVGSSGAERRRAPVGNGDGLERRAACLRGIGRPEDARQEESRSFRAVGERTRVDLPASGSGSARRRPDSCRLRSRLDSSWPARAEAAGRIARSVRASRSDAPLLASDFTPGEGEHERHPCVRVCAPNSGGMRR
jgi:hypothetical protein